MADPNRPNSENPAKTTQFYQDELDPRIAEIVDDYYQKLSDGNAPSIDSVVAEHQDLANELRDCLEGLGLLRQSQPPNKQAPRQLGDFRIIREIGRGGMGIVYEAEQISLKRRVALKVLRYALADPEAMERFQREAETVAKLHHSNVVPIFAVGEEGGTHYFAMQFIDGKGLDQLQREQTENFDCFEVAKWGLQAAEALAFAHQHDVIHRDVKPSNLICDKDGRIWLTDFGLAKRLDDACLSRTGTVLGTPRYMSPEQASSVSLPVDHRTDIYSLGATLYELTTGKALFEVNSPHVAINQVIESEPLSPRSIRPSIPRDLETIVLRCLTKEAEGRYNTADELSSDLRAFTEGRPIKARRPNLVAAFARWLQRNQRSVTVAASAAAVVAAAILGSWLISKRLRESHVGKIQFNMDEMYSAPVVARIVKPDGTEAVPSFTLPSQHPIEIEQGDYDLQLTCAGEPSENRRLRVTPYEDSRLSVKLRDRNLWPAKQIDGPWEIIHLQGRSNILVFDRWGISLMSGATSEELWRIRLEDQKQLVDDLDAAGFEWKWDLQNEGKFEQFPAAYVYPAGGDLNADGTEDLFLLPKKMPAVLALSGEDGSLIWHQLTSSKVEYRAYAESLPQPLIVDINEDGTPDVVSQHTLIEKSNLKSYVSYVVATSGKNGERMWRSDMDSDVLVQQKSAPLQIQWRGVNHSSRETDWDESVGREIVYRRDYASSTSPMPTHFVPHSPELVAHDHDAIVVVADELLRINLRNGKTAKTNLGFFPCLQPRVMNADEDPEQELLLCEQLSGHIIDGLWQKGHFVRTVCWDVVDQAVIWERVVEAGCHWILPNFDAEHPWPIVDDLDGDGTSEIVIPNTPAINSMNTVAVAPTGTLEAWDASTGEPKWLTGTEIVHCDSQINHFVAVPDCNDDGIRDVATVTLFEGMSTRGQQQDSWTPLFHAFVDVVSGHSGEKLFTIQSSPIPNPRDLPIISSLDIVDDLLVVGMKGDVEFGPGGFLLGFSLSARKETLNSHRLRQARVSDLDDDGHQDLVSWLPKRQWAGGGQIKAWRLDVGSQMRRVWDMADETLTPVGDVNGDGFSDALARTKSTTSAGSGRQLHHVRVVSGKSGDDLWKRSIPNRFAFGVRLNPLSFDVDGDGADELLAGFSLHQTHKPVVQLLSGKNGKTIWRFEPETAILLRWNAEKALIHDLDGDGSPECLLYGQTNALSALPSITDSAQSLPIALFCLDATTGRLNWSNEFEGRVNRANLLLECLRVQFADANSDGVKDIISLRYGANESPSGIALNVVDGASGERLWDTTAGQFPNKVKHLETTAYPRFVVAEDKVKPQVVSLSYGSRRSPETRLDVVGMDLATGKELWTKTEKASNRCLGRRSTQSNPQSNGETVITRFRTSKGDRVGYWFETIDATSEFVLLDVGVTEPGEVMRKTLASSANGFDSAWNQYTKYATAVAHDVDEDGLDELIYTTPESLVVYSLENDEELLQYEMPNEYTRVEKIYRSAGETYFLLNSEVNNRQHSKVTIVSDKGESLWLCRFNGDKDDTERAVLEVNAQQDTENGQTQPTAPRLLVRDRTGVSCYASVDPRDRNTLLRGQNAANEFDIRRHRILPHGPDRYLEGVGLAMIFSTILVGLPFYYLRLISRWRWSLRTFLMAPAVAAVFLVFVRSDFLSAEQNTMASWQFNLLIAFMGLPMLLLVRFLFVNLRQGKWKLALSLCLVGIGLSFSLILSIDGMLAGVTGFRPIWTWRSIAFAVGQGLQIAGVFVVLYEFIRLIARPFLGRSDSKGRA